MLFEKLGVFNKRWHKKLMANQNWLLALMKRPKRQQKTQRKLLKKSNKLLKTNGKAKHGGQAYGVP